MLLVPERALPVKSLSVSNALYVYKSPTTGHWTIALDPALQLGFRSVHHINSTGLVLLLWKLLYFEQCHVYCRMSVPAVLSGTPLWSSVTFKLGSSLTKTA